MPIVPPDFSVVLKTQNQPNRIIWHHSADNYGGEQFNKINEAHRLRGFLPSRYGLHIGYHWLIEKSGEVIRGRREEEVGMHDADENMNSIGVCLAGNFSHELPTERQKEEAARLCGEIMRRWKIPITRIEPHRWGDATECPGRRLHDLWFAMNYVKWETNWLQKLVYRWILNKI